VPYCFRIVSNHPAVDRDLAIVLSLSTAAPGNASHYRSTHINRFRNAPGLLAASCDKQEQPIEADRCGVKCSMTCTLKIRLKKSKQFLLHNV
jgi:hypothetical protein